MKKKSSYLVFCLILLVFLVIQCGGKPGNPNDDVDMNEIKNAPPKINKQDRDFHLYAFLWRDFMPISPPDGKEMIVVIKIIATDSLMIPTTVTSDRMWVIYGEQVWSTGYSETQQGNDFELVKVARGGPKWETGVKVDVVVEVKNGSDRFFLRSADVEIIRTD